MHRKRSHKSTYDLVKKNRSPKHSHKCDGVGRIRLFPFSSDSAYDSVVNNLVKTRLSESEAGAEGLTNNNACSHTL